MPENYRSTSRELLKQPVIAIEAKNLEKAEIAEIKKMLNDINRKRSHSKKPRLLFDISNIAN